MNQKIQDQDQLAEIICDNIGNEIPRHLEFTSFEYIETDKSKEYIENMFSYIHSILPFVFVFNDRLHKVEVVDQNITTLYKRNKIDNYELNLDVNTLPVKLSFIFDEENNIKIVLPQSGNKFNEVPKLFLFYPLIETVGIGISFLIHAQEFKPNKERDYLFLLETNDEIKKDVDTNKMLLERAFELVIDKITNDESLDFLSIVNICFQENEQIFIKNKKVEFINSVKDLSRIKINDNFVSLNSISYLHSEVLEFEDSELYEIYSLLLEFYELPSFEDYIYLSKLVNNWGVDSFTLLKFRDVISHISQNTNGLYSNIINKKGYITLIKSVGTDIELLNEINAIPNIHNEFKVFNKLKKWETIESSLIKVMDDINSHISGSYLNREFYFLDNITKYTREDFKDDLNKFNNDSINQLENDEEDFFNVGSVKFHSVIETLIYFVSLNKVTETNKRFYEFFGSVFKLNENVDSILSPTVVLNYDSSFKLLSRLYIKFITLEGKGYIKTNIEKLKEFIDILDKNTELKKNLLDKLVCYPNQLYNLKSQLELKKDLVKDDDFKDIYFKITDNEIRNELLLEGFESYLSHESQMTGIQLGDKIELILNANKIFIPINETNENNLSTYLELIEYISKPNSNWAGWLPNLNKVKEEILMYKFQDEKTRSSLFNILSETNEKINLLGELALIEDLESLIKAGKEKQKEEARKNNHLIYINMIGLRIQDLIQKQLDNSLAGTIEIIESTTDEKLATIEEQNGQDFIIYKSGTPIYFIEVKSRWDSDGIVALSKRQVECCAKNKGIYAVITVNVADYKARNKIVEENISFEDLYNDVYVNIDLCENFEQLIKENQQFETIIENAKLIEFRGHIPQDRIKHKGTSFDKFIENLKLLLLK